MNTPSRIAVIIGAVGLIASTITIFVFLTGITSIPQAVAYFQHAFRLRTAIASSSAASMLAVLTIRSNVDDNHVFLDGSHLGSTPLTVNVKPGVHAIKIEKQGCTGASRELSISAGEAGATDLTLTCSDQDLSAFAKPVPPDYDPGRMSRLDLAAAELNGRWIDAKQPQLTVGPGECICGSVTLKAYSSWTDAAIAFGMSPSWGNHAQSVVDLGSFNSPVEGLARHAQIALRAPNAPGQYYIIFAFRAEYTAAQVFSATNWTANALVWNNGDDVADWTKPQIEEAIHAGRVAARYVVPEGAVYIPAAAIIINVVNRSGA